MENPEEQFNKRPEDQKPEWSESLRERFEEILRRAGEEHLLGKEGYKFIISGRDAKSEPFKVLAEFDTIVEAQDWYKTFSDYIEEDGGELRIDYGPSQAYEEEFNKLMKKEGMEKHTRPLKYKYIVQVPYPDPSHPTILAEFDTKEARKKWCENEGRGFEIADVGKLQLVDVPEAADESDD